MLEKVAEYLRAGVSVACVFDPETESVRVFRADQPPFVLAGVQELKLPEIFGDEFAVAVDRFFA